MKNNLMIDNYRNTLNFLFGSLSGLIGTVLLYPTYLIKRILQANDKKDFRLIDHMKHLYQRQGFKGFYLGLSMTLLKTVPYQGLVFLLNEQLKTLLKY
jgi:hypothetical protein